MNGIMRREAQFHGLEAKVAYNHTPQGIGAGSGGLCSWRSPKLSHLVKKVGQDSGGCIQWFQLSNVPGDNVGILNIYAPHMSQARCALWE